jgi:hypothetical protein
MPTWAGVAVREGFSSNLTSVRSETMNQKH